jgi:hypothetical protein
MQETGKGGKETGTGDKGTEEGAVWHSTIQELT